MPSVRQMGGGVVRKFLSDVFYYGFCIPLLFAFMALAAVFALIQFAIFWPFRVRESSR